MEPGFSIHVRISEDYPMNLPNKLTLARVIAVPFFIIAYLTQNFYIAVILFILASVTDMLDGKIARRYNLVTNFGKIMDPLADKVLVYSAFCLFVGDHVMPGWMLIIILAREFAVAGMRTVAASEGIVIAADMSGKIKTVLQMFAVPLLLIDRSFLAVSYRPGWYSVVHVLAYALLWASLAMTVISGASYILKNKQVFSDKPAKTE